MAGRNKAGGKGKARPDFGVADTAEVTQAEMAALVETAASINIADTEIPVEDADTVACAGSDDTAEVSRAEMAAMVEAAASIDIDDVDTAAENAGTVASAESDET